jgi:hypothetical protein
MKPIHWLDYHVIPDLKTASNSGAVSNAVVTRPYHRPFNFFPVIPVLMALLVLLVILIVILVVACMKWRKDRKAKVGHSEEAGGPEKPPLANPPPAAPIVPAPAPAPAPAPVPAPAPASTPWTDVGETPHIITLPSGEIVLPDGRILPPESTV